jgi:hypothetical protein
VSNPGKISVRVINYSPSLFEPTPKNLFKISLNGASLLKADENARYSSMLCFCLALHPLIEISDRFQDI